MRLSPFFLSAMTALARSCLAAALLSAVAAVQAADFNAIGLLTQSEFRELSRDVGAAASYKGLVPAESMGLTGFDVSIAAGATDLSNRGVWRKAASGGSVPSAVPSVSLRAIKGLPLNIDIGASLTRLPGTGVQALGGELRWAFIEGGTLTPAVAARLALSQLSGVSQLKLRTQSLDLSTSKGFGPLTPYGGIGVVRVSASAPGATLTKEGSSLTKVFAGLNVGYTPLAFGFEIDKTGDATSYGAKAAVRW
jgi:hypothetical protein